MNGLACLITPHGFISAGYVGLDVAWLDLYISIEALQSLHKTRAPIREGIWPLLENIASGTSVPCRYIWTRPRRRAYYSVPLPQRTG